MRINYAIGALNPVHFCNQKTLPRVVGKESDEYYFSCGPQNRRNNALNDGSKPAETRSWEHYFGDSRPTGKVVFVRLFPYYLASRGINIQMRLTFLMVFPRDLHLAPCYLSSSSTTYPFMLLHLRLICMLTTQRWLPVRITAQLID